MTATEWAAVGVAIFAVAISAIQVLCDWWRCRRKLAHEKAEPCLIVDMGFGSSHAVSIALDALFGIPLDRAFFVRLSATFSIDVPASVCEVGAHDSNQPGRFGGRVFPLDDTINPHALASAIQSSRDFVQTASSLAKCGVTPMSLGM